MTGRSRCTCDLDTYAPPDLFGHLDPRCPRYRPPRSRVHVANFEHTHRVWMPDPPRRFFEDQGIEKVDRPRWWNR
jgi:hypothetical protein